jgi:hypothetical protein
VAPGKKTSTTKRKSPATSRPGRVPVDRAIVRVVTPTAEELTPSQRAHGVTAGVDLEKLALLTARMDQARTHARRAGENDAAHALRDRHHVALNFARWLVLELESLKPTAEGADGASERDAADLDAVIASAEAARARWVAPKRPASAAKARDDGAPTRIGAVKAALEHAARWRKQHHARPPVDIGGGVRHGVFDVEADFIRAEACRGAPDLACIPISEWQRAIDAFPSQKQGRGGDPKKRARPWHDVVFDLLKPHDLAGASTAKAMRSTLEKAATNRARPSRAKT